MPFGTISALFLSHYILSYVPSNQLKLQKLVYYTESWHLAYFDCSLIPEEFEAWVHGPVVRSIWDHYKGRGNIFHSQFSLRPEASEKIRTYAEQKLNPEQIEMIGDVLKEYGDKTAYHLESLSHSEPPWKEARRGYDQSERSDNIISKDTMRRYYQSLFAK